MQPLFSSEDFIFKLPLKVELKQFFLPLYAKRGQRFPGALVDLSMAFCRHVSSHLLNF